MKKDYTTIALIVDSSGSMQIVANDTIGGVNTFIDKQREIPGECSISLVQFNDEIKVIHDFVDIRTIPTLTSQMYYPMGGTALLDAIGVTCQKLGEKLSSMTEEQRPSKVIIAVITDGQENSSRSYNREKIKAMIQEQESKYSWDFNFISADIDSFSDAQTYGFTAGKTAMYSTDCTDATFSALSSKTSRVRCAVAKGVSEQELCGVADFNNVELTSMVNT